jgi:hypothetical protein
MPDHRSSTVPPAAGSSQARSAIRPWSSAQILQLLLAQFQRRGPVVDGAMIAVGGLPQ